MLTNCKGVLLDLDHTLYDYHACHQQSMQAVYDHLTKKFPLSREDFEQAFKVSKKKVNAELAHTASSHNRMLYFQKMFETLNLHPLKDTLEVYHAYWDTFLSVMEFDEGVPELLEKLSSTKKICLVTDLTVHIQHRKVQKLKLHKYVQHMVSSEEAGREKPAPVMFQLSLNKLGLKNSEVCMIGDNYKKDILGAINMNIASYWINRDNEQEPSHELVTELKSFKELENYA